MHKPYKKLARNYNWLLMKCLLNLTVCPNVNEQKYLQKCVAFGSLAIPGSRIGSLGKWTKADWLRFFRNDAEIKKVLDGAKAIPPKKEAPKITMETKPANVTNAGKVAKPAPQASDGASLSTKQASLWSKSEFEGVRVYQRNDLIDPLRKDKNGLTNLELMRAGRAPIGPDGNQIQLHHTIQRPDGPLAEVTRTFHQDYKSIIHINPNTIPSGINRPVFDRFRERYWKNRAKDFEK